MNIREQVLSFLDCCDEIFKCKFIMATTKIKDILKCIVNCPELYRLFEAVTQNFNYPEVKPQCLISVNDGVYPCSYVVLPQTLGNRLAFIFCLLVEFDKGTLSFNDFLRKYFPEDGSYFASHRAFCNTIIKPLQEAVSQVFAEELSAPAPENNAHVVRSDAKKSQFVSAILLAVSEEIAFVRESAIPADDKNDGIKILSALAQAVKNEDGDLIEALTFGYDYFVLYHKCASNGVASLVQAIANFKELISV